MNRYWRNSSQTCFLTFALTWVVQFSQAALQADDARTPTVQPGSLRSLHNICSFWYLEVATKRNWFSGKWESTFDCKVANWICRLNNDFLMTFSSYLTLRRFDEREDTLQNIQVCMLIALGQNSIRRRNHQPKAYFLQERVDGLLGKVVNFFISGESLTKTKMSH